MARPAACASCSRAAPRWTRPTRTASPRCMPPADSTSRSSPRCCSTRAPRPRREELTVSLRSRWPAGQTRPRLRRPCSRTAPPPTRVTSGCAPHATPRPRGTRPKRSRCSSRAGQVPTRATGAAGRPSFMPCALAAAPTRVAVAHAPCRSCLTRAPRLPQRTAPAGRRCTTPPRGTASPRSGCCSPLAQTPLQSREADSPR
mmetsp:Transcript_31776/g.100216  ORF Transcript_31776/g.100216 Transcript_31776/m.100216 type:complete len:201 (-) Transcript_31776:265-867(-)